MKKKAIRRLLSLVMAFAMVFPLAAAASAVSPASVSWSSGSYSYSATVTPGDSCDKLTLLSNTKTGHTQGTATTIYVSPSNTASQTIDPLTFIGRDGYETDSQYLDYLQQALRRSGLYTSRSYVPSSNTGYTIPSTNSSGYYAVGVVFYGYAATWSVKGLLMARTAVITFDEGSFTYASDLTVSTPVVVRI